MSDETKSGCLPSAIPHVSLRDYMEKLLAEQLTLIKSILDERDKAFYLAQENIKLRLNSMNELHEQINRERGSFMSRDRYDTLAHLIDVHIANLEKFSANIQGRIWMAGGLIVIINIALQIWGKK